MVTPPEPPILNGMPALAFGTYPLKGAEAEAAVSMALEVGFRHIDTAQIYGNEAAVGQALATAGLPRSDLFVTTKVGPDALDAASFLPSVHKSLDALKLPHVDLLLIHWPPKTEAALDQAIARLASAANAGLARHIGVSNFTIAQMQRAAARCPLPLIVNQVEFHPLIDQSRLRRAADALDIRLMAFCALGRGALLGNATIGAVAQAHGVSEAAVILRWIIQQRVVALSMSTKRENAAGNLRAAHFALSDADMAGITALTVAHRRFISPTAWAPAWDAA